MFERTQQLERRAREQLTRRIQVDVFRFCLQETVIGVGGMELMAVVVKHQVRSRVLARIDDDRSEWMKMVRRRIDRANGEYQWKKVGNHPE